MDFAGRRYAAWLDDLGIVHDWDGGANRLVISLADSNQIIIDDYQSGGFGLVFDPRIPNDADWSALPKAETYISGAGFYGEDDSTRLSARTHTFFYDGPLAAPVAPEMPDFTA